MANSTDIAPPVVKIIVCIIIAMIVVFYFLFTWGIPALERHQDRRYIERQYERTEYRHEYECKIGYKPKSECEGVKVDDRS